MNRVAKFLSAHGVWPATGREASRPITSHRPTPSAERSAASVTPQLHPLVASSVLNYRLVLENYEKCRILGMKADKASLDLAKIEIGESVLESVGVRSWITESEIREALEALERAGETPRAPRPAIPMWLRWKVYARDGYKCVQCFRRWGLTCDHIVPVSKGGETTERNLQTLCGPCNSRKGAS